MRPALRLTTTVLAVLALAACSGGDEPDTQAAAPEPTVTATEATPPPEPEPEPVEGVVRVERVDVSSAVGLGLPAPEAASDAAVDAFVGDVTDLLDGHVAAMTDGATSPLVDAALGGLLADPAAEASLAALAGPEDPVTEATYAMTVSAAADPEWATVLVTTTSEGGTTADATLLFTPEDDGPALVGVGEVDA